MSVKDKFIHSPVFIVCCFFAVLVFALGTSRLSQSNESRAADTNLPLLVEVVGYEPIDGPVHGMVNGERYVGRIEAGQRTEVGFDISGVITSVLKSEGDTFVKGEALATLDTERLMAKKKELEAGVRRAQAGKKLARSSLQRAQSLRASRNISEQALDEAIQNKNSADAEYELVIAQQASVDVELGKAKLIAPFSGIVIDRMTDEGRATNPGAPVLLLEQLGKTEIRVGLPLKEARNLAVGDILKVERNQETFSATIERINLALSTSRVSEIYLLPKDYEAQTLISGELVSVVLEKNLVFDQGVWLPLSALTEYGRGLWSVYLAQPEVKGDTSAIVERTIVEVVQIQGEFAQVKGGVTEDTIPYVVKSSTHRVVAGQHVQIGSLTASATEK
jgi:membrane fusion protein, multidrug efflux system